MGQHATQLLAGFSLGGSCGMEMHTVAQLFGLPLLDVRRDMALLAAGGIVQQMPGGKLAVRPPGLQHTLVRDLLFQGALSLPVEPFLAAAPDASEVVRVLIGARSRGSRAGRAAAATSGEPRAVRALGRLRFAGAARDSLRVEILSRPHRVRLPVRH